MKLKASKVLYLKGRKYGILKEEQVSHWVMGGPKRNVLTIQRINHLGEYIHSPIKVYGHAK